MIQGGNTAGMTLCCRNDGYARNPLMLPPNKPFVLFPTAYNCQQVYGMTSELVRIYFNTIQVKAEGTVKTYIAGNTLHACYYHRK